MRVMGAFASRRVYPPAPRLNCRALSFIVRLSAHAHISRERLGNWFRGRDSNPRQPAYEAGLEPSPGTPIYMAGTVGNRTHHKRFKVKRGPSTVAVWSRTTRLGESNTRPGPLVRDHPGWHNPRLDCHTPRPDDCAPKSRSPEFARLYRAGRIFRCSFQQGMELKVGLEPTTYALQMRRSTN